MDCIRFEVHGKVQHVHFRKGTQITATALSLRGWVMNTPEKTVVGEAYGDRPALEKLASWLQNTGSSKSRIDRAELRWDHNCEYAPAEFVVRKEFVLRKEAGARRTWSRCLNRSADMK